MPNETFESHKAQLARLLELADDYKSERDRDKARRWLTTLPVARFDDVRARRLAERVAESLGEAQQRFSAGPQARPSPDLRSPDAGSRDGVSRDVSFTPQAHTIWEPRIARYCWPICNLLRARRSMPRPCGWPTSSGDS
jgi:hypothetical protein